MRFVLAIVSFMLAAVMIGYGIAQQTILATPDEVSVSTETDGTAPLTVISGEAFNTYSGNQTIRIEGPRRIVAAYGRSTDVIAWVGDASYNMVTVDPETGDLVSETITGTEQEVPDPYNSDLWLENYEAEDELALTVKIPSDVSFILASDGVDPAPNAVSLSWPLDNSTPWAGTLILGGAAVLLIGLIFLMWAVHHMRRAGGPRRKPQKMPKVPKKPRYKPSKRGAKASDAPSLRTSVRVAVPTVLVSALILSGCTASTAPNSAADQSDPTPTPTSTSEGSTVTAPAVAVRQIEKIVAQISAVSQEADEERDSDLLETRFSDAALEYRLANYKMRKADDSIALPVAIPDGPVQLTLPQQTETWPRTVFTIILDETDSTVAPIALFLEQATPRDNYKVSYAMNLEPSVVFPDVAAASVGTSRLPADSGLLRSSPTEVALDYAEILEQDVDSDSYLDFEAEGDSLRVSVGLAVKNKEKAALSSTATLTYGHELGSADPIAMATIDAGAIVAVHLYETKVAAPKEEGSAVTFSGQTKALSGISITEEGIKSTYGDQLLFYVPAAGSGEKIVLLGYTQGLVAASELK
ncbi:hypothetical protein CLV85_1174 [Salinibacterium amurskyense]|uniref:DUF8094 domain-containing protein n=1 Tax=Salinibacterium amurskyense TaxID=205941 RepID=A0A2M9D8M3_9MICO|nr:hypothetical protein [Salinibacterium amurskyense]PJJ81988.1 hypothetical protein CLV85_1174 [Salinibacterium amurskyense]GHD78564.1 hypothetical protein GCM10007394_06470 [Salinibacterium amurskyense]